MVSDENGLKKKIMNFQLKISEMESISNSIFNLRHFLTFMAPLGQKRLRDKEALDTYNLTVLPPHEPFKFN